MFNLSTTDLNKLSVEEIKSLAVNELNGLLNEDVYKKPQDKRDTLSNYEVMQNYYNNFNR